MRLGFLMLNLCQHEVGFPDIIFIIKPSKAAMGAPPRKSLPCRVAMLVLSGLL